MSDAIKNDRLGTLTQTANGWQLQFVRQLNRPPAIAWRAFVEPELVARWFPSSIEGELVTGSPLTFTIPQSQAEPFHGEVIDAQEPHRLVLRWGPDVLRFELTEIPAGTALTMTVELSELGRAARDTAGWHECLDKLAKEFGESDAATWADLHPIYVARFGPEASTIGPPQEYLETHAPPAASDERESESTQAFEIQKEIELPASAEQVWAAIATGPGLAAWFMSMDIDPNSSMVVAWQPGQHLAIQTPAEADGSSQTFDYRIDSAESAHTLLRFSHRGTMAGDANSYARMMGYGWDMYLYTLGQYLTHFAGQPAVYIEAEASASGPDDWSLLLQALGGAASLGLGSPISFDLGEAGIATGVIDYNTATFLGARTANALIRFHGRALIAMPIAVSHHAYGESVDAAAITAGWQSWLTTTLAPR